MNPIGQFLWGHLVEPYRIVFDRRTVRLIGSSLRIWRSARRLFRSALERAAVATPSAEDWQLRTVIYGFGNVTTTCRGSPAAIGAKQLKNHWDSVRAHFAPFDELLQLIARIRALAVALFYPGSLMSMGLFYGEYTRLVTVVLAFAAFWGVLHFAIPALLRWRLRAI